MNRKIAILGDRGIGKTAIIRQFVEEKYIDRYEPTTEATYNKIISFLRISFETVIVDTAGIVSYYCSFYIYFI